MRRHLKQFDTAKGQIEEAVEFFDNQSSDDDTDGIKDIYLVMRMRADPELTGEQQASEGMSGNVGSFGFRERFGGNGVLDRDSLERDSLSP